MTIKEKVEEAFILHQLWCSKCLKDLNPDSTWIADDMHDGRMFCYDCAPDDAIRVKDLT